jgi:hypothetical protein
VTAYPGFARTALWFTSSFLCSHIALAQFTHASPAHVAGWHDHCSSRVWHAAPRPHHRRCLQVPPGPACCCPVLTTPRRCCLPPGRRQRAGLCGAPQPPRQHVWRCHSSAVILLVSLRGNYDARLACDCTGSCARERSFQAPVAADHTDTGSQQGHSIKAKRQLITSLCVTTVTCRLRQCHQERPAHVGLDGCRCCCDVRAVILYDSDSGVGTECSDYGVKGPALGCCQLTASGRAHAETRRGRGAAVGWG